MSNHDTLAAVDLGSNSFHLIIARVEDGQLQIIDRIKDMVRLGGGLDDQNNLSDEAAERAINALAKFGERLRDLPSGSVRALGTNTLRRAKNSGNFLERAQDALGHRIEIISGTEEGRLIYLGVAHGIFDPDRERRLIIDIGGGSTELIVGEGFDVIACQSTEMGCVSYSKRFFEDQSIDAARFDRAITSARQLLRGIENSYPKLGWRAAFGASGTIRAIRDIITSMNGQESPITLQDMYKLRDKAIEAGHIDELDLPGLSKRRQPVFVGGLSILIGAFESLGIQEMTAADFALREGAIYDLHGRQHNEDVREITVSHMATRYGVDLDHAERVVRTAERLRTQVADDWDLDTPELARYLSWAGTLHEIGLAISHNRYHKHGSYLVENSYMPGFSRSLQQLMWALIRTHRGDFKPHRFARQPEPLRTQGKRLCVLLRLAVLLNRARSENNLATNLRAHARENELTLEFDPEHLANAPLTREDLRTEQRALRGAGFSVKFD